MLSVLRVVCCLQDSGSDTDDGDSNETKKGESNRDSVTCGLKPSFVAPPVPPLIPSKEVSKTKSCLGGNTISQM